MKKVLTCLSLILLPALMFAFTTATARADQPLAAKIQSAMSAAPIAIAQDAAIMDYPAKMGDPFIELRQGSNGWICFPDSPASPGNDPQCYDKTFMQWNEALMTGADLHITTPGLSYMLQGGSDPSNTDPMATEPAAGEDWITTPPHVMLLAPGKLDTSLFSTDPKSGGPYIMWAGTPYEHLMVPVEAHQTDKIVDKAQSAMSAAPLAVARDATILDNPAGPGQPFVELRKGSNGWTCFPDGAGTPGNDPSCMDKMWMQWNDAIMAGTDPKITAPGIGYMLAGGSDASNTDPMATAPAPGEDWVSSSSHVMILLPGKLDPTLFSTDPHSGGPYIMWAGTPYEHIMMPIQTDKIQSAMSAAPMAIAKDATIVDYPADPTAPLIELRQGSNGWTCFPDWAATPGNDPQCFDKMWMEWLNALTNGTKPKITQPGLAYMLQGGSDASNTDPMAMAPAPGEDWVSTPPHVMILLPGKLDPTLFSSDHHYGGPYVMFAGTPYEHIMMPVEVEEKVK